MRIKRHEKRLYHWVAALAIACVSISTQTIACESPTFFRWDHTPYTPYMEDYRSTEIPDRLMGSIVGSRERYVCSSREFPAPNAGFTADSKRRVPRKICVPASLEKQMASLLEASVMTTPLLSTESYSHINVFPSMDGVHLKLILTQWQRTGNPEPTAVGVNSISKRTYSYLDAKSLKSISSTELFGGRSRDFFIRQMMGVVQKSYGGTAYADLYSSGWFKGLLDQFEVFDFRRDEILVDLTAIGQGKIMLKASGESWPCPRTNY